MDDRTRLETLDRTILEEWRGNKPEAQLRGWLTAWSGAGRGSDFPLYEGRNFVGSAAIASVRIADEGFPDLACNIRINAGQWMLIDIDSDCGTMVNDEQVFRHELEDEDWIKYDKLLFRIKKK